MNRPLVDAFFIGRALAEALYDQAERTFTDVMSELGKFDAEQRENLRAFTQQVIERANREAEMALQGRSTTAIVRFDSPSGDLQEVIDELRAEIAQLRAELQRYRSRSL